MGDDLRAAGGDVSLRGFVTDHAAIVGGAVHIAEGSAIAGRTWIAAGTLDMAGQIGADLRVFARTAVIAGQIRGNVEITAREIRIEPGAVIGGHLVWHSEQPPLIAEDALILGDVAGTAAPVDELPEAAAPAFDGWALGVAILVAAAGVFWLSPALVERSGALLHASPLARYDRSHCDIADPVSDRRAFCRYLAGCSVCCCWQPTCWQYCCPGCSDC